jgi:hypothetical protein
VSAEQISLNKDLTAMARKLGVEVIDPTSKLYKVREFRVTTDDKQFIYTDKSHLRSLYVRGNAQYIVAALVGRLATAALPAHVIAGM